MSALQDEISIGDAKEITSLLDDLLRHVNVLSATQLNSTSIIAVAAKFETTFYDAPYLVAARRKKLTLATVDEKLTKIASEYEVPSQSKRGTENNPDGQKPTKK